jgi:hypothetical protein
MTIQQMMFGGGMMPISFVGYNEEFTGTARSSIVIVTPSNTEIGDLILFFGNTGGNAATWSNTQGVTEMVDANASPNLYASRITASSAGATAFTFSLSASRFISAYCLVYRNAVFQSSAFTYRANVNSQTGNSVSTTISPSTNGSAIIAHIAARSNSSITWTNSSALSPANVFTSFNGDNDFPADRLIDFYPVDGSSTTITTGTTANWTTIQQALVAIGPAA